MSRDAGSIPAASTPKGLARNRKSFFCWRLRVSQILRANQKQAKYPISYPILDASVSDFVESDTSIRPVFEFWLAEFGDGSV